MPSTKLAALIALGSLAGATYAGNLSDKCDTPLSHHLSNPQLGNLNVIVQWDGKPTTSQMERARNLGFSSYRNLEIIHSEAGSLPAKNLRKLLAMKAVKHVSTDLAVQKTDAFSVGSSYASVGWSKYKAVGTGVGVAVLDSGISNIADLNSLPGLLGIIPLGKRLQNQVDFTGEGLNDKCGHGTHVAGLIAGDASMSYGPLYTQSFFGIAPAANLYSVKVLDKTGAGTVSNVVAAIGWVVKNAKANNIRIINMSMGHPVGESYTTDPVCQAAEAAWKAGIVVVCAAGNEGRLNVNPSGSANNSGYGTNYWSVESPGNDPYVITVGATKSEDGNRANDQIASYSGRGPSRLDCILKPDIIAPGNLITSAEDTGNSYLVQEFGSQIQILNSSYTLLGLGIGYSKTYFKLSGTSMATPVIAGAVAQMLQMNPNISPDTVKARLMISADKWTDTAGNGDPCTFGAGYINIPAAITCPAIATTYSMSPSLYEDSMGNVYANLDPSIYGQRAMWGTGSSTTDIYGQRAMWGTTASSSKLTTRAMWGTSGWSDTTTDPEAASGIDCSSSSIIIRGEK